MDLGRPITAFLDGPCIGPPKKTWRRAFRNRRRSRRPLRQAREMPRSRNPPETPAPVATAPSRSRSPRIWGISSRRRSRTSLLKKTSFIRKGGTSWIPPAQCSNKVDNCHNNYYIEGMDLSFLIPSKVRREVLRFFVENPSVEMGVREIARELKFSPQITHRELVNL